MESTASIEQFQEELQSWKHELSSIKTEIRHFEHSLEKMGTHKLPKSLLAQLEHFQNSFICQKEVIDKLRHDLPDSRHKVENIFNRLRVDAHHALNERMDMFRRIYEEVKSDFMRFQSEWM
jgi:cell division septum initiation protein DivIVA